MAQNICVVAKKAFIVNFKAKFLGKNDKVSFPLYNVFSVGRGLVDSIISFCKCSREGCESNIMVY